MKVVFFGTPQFSAEILEFLTKLPLELCAIVTRVDKPKGRSLKLGVSPVKEKAQLICPDIPLLQPERASAETFCKELSSFNADLFFVVAYGEILKDEVLSIPKKACINVHTSLLPKYRGAAPMQRCIMAGEIESGVTFMEMVLKMDAGDLLIQEKVSVTSDMNVASLESLILEASKKRLPEFLANFDEYYSKKIAQNESEVTFASKITPEDSVIDLTNDAKIIHDQVRGLSPSPGAYVKVKFGPQIKRLKILKTIPYLNSTQHQPGDVWIENLTLYFAVGKGYLEIQEVQLEGKKPMQTRDFLRGVPKHFTLIV
jgi:methionyl-tRNA formyltransferase